MRCGGVSMTARHRMGYHRRMRALAILLLAGCGRSGFELRTDGSSSATDGRLATGNASVLDLFDAISYDNNDGSQDWATSWIEVGDDGSPLIALNSTIFVESHPQNPTPDTPALKIRVATSGQYVYREANLTGTTEATLSYRFHNELQTTGVVEAQASSDGGTTWTTLRTYTEADVYGTETIPLTASATAATQIRFIATAAGGRHLRVDDVEIAFTRP
jgi:MSHA biogenesis protein MshQ